MIDEDPPDERVVLAARLALKNRRMARLDEAIEQHADAILYHARQGLTRAWLDCSEMDAAEWLKARLSEA